MADLQAGQAYGGQPGHLLVRYERVPAGPRVGGPSGWAPEVMLAGREMSGIALLTAALASNTTS